MINWQLLSLLLFTLLLFGFCLNNTTFSSFQIRSKQLKGWGRIHAVNYLEATTDEMKLWLFTEGYKNNIHYGYSLCDCFVKSGVPELLKGDLTEEELEVIGQFIEMLMEDGPIGNIYALDNAEEILYDYRQHLD